MEQLNYDISFLYSDEQNIEIEDKKESYNFKFYIGCYNDETLFTYGERNNFIVFDYCKKNGIELNCEISKEKLEEILIRNNEKFRVGAINDTIGIIYFYFISNININYKISQKENIFVEITELLSKNSQEGTPIAFRTNVTDIPNINSDIYDLCYFKKSKNSPLLYLCYFNTEISSFRMDYTIILSNSHYKYNFIIRPSEVTYYFSIYPNGATINLAYPTILDFSSKESLIIRYITLEPSLAKNLKLEPD